MACDHGDVILEESNNVLDSYEKKVDEDGDSYLKLTEIIKIKDAEINALTKRAERAERLLDKAHSYNDELRAEITLLSSELHGYRKSNKNRISVSSQVSDNDFYEVDATYATYSENKPMPSWGPELNDSNQEVSISDHLKAAAEEVLQSQNVDADPSSNQPSQAESSSEYVYDAGTGFYYHPASGYYWEPNLQLFYDYTTGTYYNYDEKTGEYAVHSQIDVTPSMEQEMNAKKSVTGKLGISKKSKRKKRKLKQNKKLKFQNTENIPDVIVIDDDSENDVCMRSKKENQLKREGNLISGVETLSRNQSDSDSGSLATGESEMESSSESGAISDEDSETSDSLTPQTPHGVIVNEEEMAHNYPPCIRVIVQKSDHLTLGALYIITCTGGTIGRESNMGHAIQISDINVSKTHAQIEYHHDKGCYFIIDKGSQNGTKLNSKWMSKSKQESAAHPLNHEDVLEVGSTQLLLHIHSGNDTCQDCEPGQVQARLKAEKTIEREHVVLSKSEKNRQRLKELKQIKKKYGLQNSFFENQGAAITNPEYSDKAYLRRKYVGSDPAESSTPSKEMPASVQSPISTANKGFKLLEKMGWKKGEGLGKDSTGISEPIQVELRVDQNAGLGSAEGVSIPLDDVHNSGKAKRWAQARRMYSKLEAQEEKSDKSDSKAWVKGETQAIFPSDTDKAVLRKGDKEDT